MRELDPSDEGDPRSVSAPPQRHVDLPVVIPSKGRAGAPFWWLLGVLCLLVAAFWVLSLATAIDRLEKRLAAPAASRDAGAYPEQQQQIRSFETRLARVLGASVESKLRALERSVERGPLSAEELRLLESAATELRLLQSNSAAGAASDRPEHPRFQSVPGTGDSKEKEGPELLHEIAKLRNIFYASLIGLALMSLTVVGLWFNSRRRYRLIEAPARHRLPVIASYREDRER